MTIRSTKTNRTNRSWEVLATWAMVALLSGGLGPSVGATDAATAPRAAPLPPGVPADATVPVELWSEDYGLGESPGSWPDVAVSPDGTTVYAVSQVRTDSEATGDYLTVAHDAVTGLQLWEARLDGPSNLWDIPSGVTVSPDGHMVYVTGTSWDGPTALDYATVAYDAATGVELWVARYDGPAGFYDWALNLVVSPDGESVFITGYSWGDGTQYDYATVAYDAQTGAELWLSRYNGPADGYDLAFNGIAATDDRVFITGQSVGIDTGYDYATLAYDAETGEELWVARYDGPGSRSDLGWDVDASSDGATVFVTGYAVGDGTRIDSTTLAYDAQTGEELWVARYDGPAGRDDGTYDLVVDPDGSKVYVAGQTWGTNWDDLVVAYDATTGEELWAARHDGGLGLLDGVYALAISPDGATLFATGTSWRAGTAYDYATIVLDAETGAELAAAHHNGDPLAFSTDQATAIVVDPRGGLLLDGAPGTDAGLRVHITGTTNKAQGIALTTVAYLMVRTPAGGVQLLPPASDGGMEQRDAFDALPIDPALAPRFIAGDATGSTEPLTGPLPEGRLQGRFPDQIAATLEMDARAQPFFGRPYLSAPAPDDGEEFSTTSSAGTHAGAFHALLQKADPALAERLRAGDTSGFRVIVTGLPHEGVTEDRFPDRGQAMSVLDARAQPLFDRIAVVADAVGGGVTGTYSAAPAMALTGELDMLLALAALSDVRHIALDFVGAAELHQDVVVDPIPTNDTGDVGILNTDGRDMIQAEAAWAAGFRGEGITVAVIDTGVDASHEAFKRADGSSRIVGWADCTSSASACNATGTPFDDHGHGTHTAGTAVGSNLFVDPARGAYQETGVATAADLIAVKRFDGSGSGTLEGGLKALQWAFDNGADVASNSWGGSCAGDLSTIQLVNQLTALGMVGVFSAGNSGAWGPGFVTGPACAESAISVGAVDTAYQRAWFSSYGPCSDPSTGTGPRICPDVVAKGLEVRSAVPTGSCAMCHPSGYSTFSGTSMAAPHVAGAVAIAEQIKRHHTGTGWDTPSGAEEAALKASALPIPLDGQTPNDEYGWGHPQLAEILALFDDAPDEAVIVDDFSVSTPVVRQGQSTRLFFSVHNVGQAPATGELRAELVGPDGTQMLQDSSISLGLYDGARVAPLFTSDDLAVGDYTFRGSFTYAWTNPTTGEEVTGNVFHEADFSVVWTEIEIHDLEGLDEATAPGDPQSITFTAKSVGSEAATNVTVRFGVPGSYQFLPSTNVDNMDPNGVYANPAPATVEHPPLATVSGGVTLTWHADELADEVFSFDARLLPARPGTHQLFAVIDYEDGAGQSYRETRLFRQHVGAEVPS